MASLNAPFFHPYVQMEQGICRLPPNVLGLIIALHNPTSPSKLKIQRGNGPFHANEIEYVSQYNCENRARLDCCLGRIEVPAESGFINVPLSTLWFMRFNGLADQTLVYGGIMMTWNVLAIMNETQTLIYLRTASKCSVQLRVKPISNKLVMNADMHDALNPAICEVQHDDRKIWYHWLQSSVAQHPVLISGVCWLFFSWGGPRGGTDLCRCCMKYMHAWIALICHL